MLGGLIAPTTADVRKVMVSGPSGILSVCSPYDKDIHGNLLGFPDYEPSNRQVTWKNGATCVTYSAEEPNRLRGPQHEFLWCDELAAWDNGQPDEAWDMAMFGLRVGDNPQALITTTPRPIPLIRELMKSPLCITTRHKTADNKENLAPTFLTRVVSKYAGTRLGRQELDGEVIDEVEGALWTRGMIEDAYMRGKPLPDMRRIVIGVDPATTSRDVSALTGIVVAGLGVDNRGYVLADYSGRYSPGEWARQVAWAFKEFEADRIIAEGNQGGEMVRHTIETAHPNLPVTIIHAKEAKQARAEPIAALYEQGRISHAEPFPDLEDQLMTWAPLMGLPSPDRLDAMVWALRNLMLDQWVDNTQLGMVSIQAVRISTDH